jgi:hypothetical protein
MTADPGSEAGAAGISAEERLALFANTPDNFATGTAVVRADTAAHIANEHARAATARAEKAEAEVARLREALTPSGATKAAYSSEVYERDVRMTIGKRAVEWTSIKAVMALALKRADAALAEPARREGET